MVEVPKPLKLKPTDTICPAKRDTCITTGECGLSAEFIGQALNGDSPAKFSSKDLMQTGPYWPYYIWLNYMERMLVFANDCGIADALIEQIRIRHILKLRNNEFYGNDG